MGYSGMKLSGRSGNDIASGLVRTLENIIQDNRSVTEITLWSDSCVPQNRNKVMAAAAISWMQFISDSTYSEVL